MNQFHKTSILLCISTVFVGVGVLGLLGVFKNEDILSQRSANFDSLNYTPAIIDPSYYRHDLQFKKFIKFFNGRQLIFSEHIIPGVANGFPMIKQQNQFTLDIITPEKYHKLYENNRNHEYRTTLLKKFSKQNTAVHELTAWCNLNKNGQFEIPNYNDFTSPEINPTIISSYISYVTQINNLNQIACREVQTIPFSH